MSDSNRPPVDCDAGRALGCGTFCCRLLVRLLPLEGDPASPSELEKRFVDKEPGTGLCVHLDRETQLCSVWDRAPQWCREFDCNRDERLQSVLRHGFTSIASFSPVYRELVPIRVPHREE